MPVGNSTVGGDFTQKNSLITVLSSVSLEPEKCWPSFVLIGLFREDGDMYSILVLSMFESTFRTLSLGLS